MNLHFVTLEFDVKVVPALASSFLVVSSSQSAQTPLALYADYACTFPLCIFLIVRLGSRQGVYGDPRALGVRACVAAFAVRVRYAK